MVVIKCTNLFTVGILDRDNRAERICEEIMAKTYPNLLEKTIFKKFNEL